MHVEAFVRGQGLFVETPYVPTEERSTRRFPLLLTTGRILSQYNVGAQSRRTENVVWYPHDVLEMHPHDAEERGVRDGDRVELASRVGRTTLPVRISERMPAGVVYTTFHFPVTGANVVTTEYSDWATNCPEYKVTAVQVTPLGTGAATSPTASDGHAAHESFSEELVRMANQIARQFAHDDHEDAVAAVADHLERFWEPHMRRTLLALVDRGAEGFDPAVLDAAGRLRVPSASRAGSAGR
jgi:formate dehydrogenase major subunit